MTRLICAKDLDRLLQSKFGTGNRFTTAYLDYFENAQNVKLETEADWERLSPTQRMWFEYALSTNGRGEDLMRAIEPHKLVRGCRLLDIGCGFGGVLVAAAMHGAECVGLEIDPVRARFSRENLADFEVNIPVYDLDALSPDIANRLGTFDLITCNDVIEHVDSAGTLLINIRRLLRPGGLVYLEVPNADSVDFVAADGHFGLFGITLLDREQAKVYHARNFHFPYDVGDYWSLEQYHEFFRRAGLAGTLIPSLYHPTREMSDLDPLLLRLEEARIADPLLDPVYLAYRERVSRDRHSIPEENFRNRYLRNFWTFVLRPAGLQDQVV